MGPRAESGPLEAAIGIVTERTPLLLPLPATAEIKASPPPVAALTAKELDQFTRQPCWVWLRLALLVAYWLVFAALLATSLALTSRCRPVWAHADPVSPVGSVSPLSPLSPAAPTTSAAAGDDLRTPEWPAMAALASAAAAAAAAIAADAELA